MQVYVTKSGAKYHRDTCRFSKGATAIDVKDSGKRAACAVCKPHLPARMIPVKSVGVETLAPCKVCKPGLADCKRDALAVGHKATATGRCYHKDTCGTLKPKTHKAKPAPKAAPAKTVIKPIRERKNAAAVEASVMSALGI